MKILEMPARVQIKNVLFATDFSDAATAAIPYAKEFAKRFGAKLFALHVMTPVVNPMTEPTAWPALIEASEREAKRQKEALLKEFKGIQPEVFIEEGGLWPILESTIEHNQIGLIVLGTHGRHGLKKMLLGSVAEILRKAPCAVLTVGPNLPTLLSLPDPLVGVLAWQVFVVAVDLGFLLYLTRPHVAKAFGAPKALRTHDQTVVKAG